MSEDHEVDFDNEEDNRTRNLAGAIEDLEKEIIDAARERQAAEEDADIVPWVIEFRIVGTPDIIRAPVSELILFGRMDDNHGIAPEVDLSNYRGQKLGVSRKHALMIARDNRVTIEDLGSANGTYINGQKIAVRRPHRVREGDILQLGNLKLQIHFVIKPSSNDTTAHGLGNDVAIPRVAEGQRLLILDDNKDVCRVLSFVGKRAGFETIVVHTMQDAISVVDEQHLDGAIVEMMLQQGSGLDLIPYMRQHSGNDAVPIIAIGNDSGGFREGQAYQRGANLFIAKPVALDALVEGLEKLAHLMPRDDQS